MVPIRQRIEYRSIDAVKPYPDNPRKNDRAVQAVANSIREFGFRNPIIVDADGTIIAGHTRHKAAQALGLEEVPVLCASDLTPEQVNAYRLADNRVGELAEWDMDLLAQELDGLADLDMSAFGFTERDMERAAGGVNFSNLDAMSGEVDDEYDEFVEKFKPKKTTDDCYTPPEVYEVIKDWACAEYGIDPSKVVRPFYPGGDYESFDYGGGKVVVDNPPFSILAQIINFYVDNGIPFFLFSPTLTGFGSMKTAMRCCHLITGGSIVYANGARVNTSFVTSYEDGVVAKTCPELRKMIDDKVDEIIKRDTVELPIYEYPDEVVTAAIMTRWSKYGVEFEVRREDCVPISELDAQKDSGKSIYGNGLLLSERAAAERAAAERAAAERAAAERAAAERAAAERAAAVKFELSEREREIVRSLGRHDG